MLRTIHLHGRLGKKFGKTHRLDVQSPAEAVRALAALFPDFLTYIAKRRYEVRIGDVAIDKDALTLGAGRRDIHFTPAGALAGIETILIIGLAIVTVATIAVTLLAMPKPPKAGDREASTKTDSFIFDGPENATEQGRCVPVVYGKIAVGSVVGSAGISTSDITAIGASSDPGSVGYTPGIKGGAFGDEWTIPLAKGGKGGGSAARAAQEDPNTLQSQATAKIIDIVSEGEIGGLVDGLKSIYFDGTPIQNPDGSFNFSGVAIEERYGLPDQAPMPGFSQTENSYGVDAEVKVSTGPVVRRLLNDDADVCRVTIGLPRLFKQDTTNGDLKQHSVSIAIDYQSDGGGFTQIVQHTFSGKNNSPYQRSFDIRLTGPGPHDIRVRRLSPDSELASIEDKTYLDLLTEIVEAKLIYPDTAMYGISIDARQFGTNIPTRSYEIYGIIVEVPTNYDPETREYTGIWDGTFKRAWTDNPAWVYRDIIVNKRYGLGRRVPPESLDKWALYAIAQYCDGLVPDGVGGYQPRYTINCCLKTAQAAYDVLASFASTFRGWTYWGSGAIIPVQDRPADPVAIVTPANVEEGKISYRRVTPKQKRRSVVVMYWNDPEDSYRLVPEIVERPDLIKRFGWKPGDELTAFGCTNRAEARRKALFVFEDEDSGNTAATYRVGDDHSFVDPGALTVIADPRYSLSRRGGRVKAATVDSITTDAPVTLEAGQAYTMRVVLPDGTTVSRDVLNAAGVHDEILLDGADFDPLPMAGAIWAIESDIVANRQFRIRSIQRDDAPYEVQALSHDPNKYARVEEGRDLPEVNYLVPLDGPLIPPSDIQVEEFLLRDGNSASPALRMAWTGGNDPRIIAFQAQYKRPGDGWTPLADGLEMGRDIRNSEPGVWGFRVRSLDALGRRTAWVQTTVTIGAATEALPEATGLNVATDNIALTATLRWTRPADVRPFRFIVWRGATADFNSATSLGETDQTEFQISQPGFYWVQTAFMDERSVAPPSIEATAGQMPNPQWDRIDDRPLDLNDLDPIAYTDISGALADIDDLYLVFGDTESAESARIAAEAAASDAVAAASAAGGYATTASTKRDEAAASATSAAASAVTAGDAASVATSQAASATSAASTAATQATLSSTYSAAARLSVAASLPGTFENDGNFFFESYSGSPETRTPIGTGGVYYFVETVAGVGKVLRTNSTASNRDVAPIGVLKVVAGRTYRATATFRTVSGTRSFAVYLLGLSDAYSYVAVTGNNSTFTATTTWQTQSVTLTGDVMLAAGISYVRCLARFNAGAESGQISECRVADVTESVTASNQATIATNQATIATAQAAAAQSSAVLSASVSRGYQNANANFADWPNAGHTNPGSGWGVWNDLGGTTVERYLVSSMGYTVQPEASPYAMHSVVTASQQTGLIGVDTPASFGIITVEASAYLSSGGWGGSGVLIYFMASGGSIISSDYLAFASEPDSGGSVSSTATGRLRKWSKQFTAPSGTALIRLYAMSNYASGFGTMAAKNVYFLKCGWRQGGAIEATVANQAATIVTQAAAIATLESRTAVWLTRVSAGTGTAEIAISATDSGGAAASEISLRADRILLGSMTDPALAVIGGDVYFSGMLNVGPPTGERINIIDNMITGYYSTGDIAFRLGFE